MRDRRDYRVCSRVTLMLAALAGGLEASILSSVNVTGNFNRGSGPCGGNYGMYNVSGETFAFGTTFAIPAACSDLGGTANSTGNVRVGSLLAIASATGEASATASASMRVPLFLFGPSSATQVSYTVDMEVTGDMSGLRNGISQTSFWRGCISATTANQGYASPGCFDNIVGNGPFSRKISLALVNIPATDGVARLDLTFFIGVTAGGFIDRGIYFHAFADLSHTALIRQTLPPGWTSQSDSGFLADSPFHAEVPEPASLGLTGAVMGLLVWLRPRH